MNSAGLSLAFANTLVLSGDRLDTPTSLGAWLDAWPEIDRRDDTVLLRLGEFRSLRDHVRTALTRTVEGVPVPDDAVDDLNGASARAPTWPVLRVDANSQKREVETSDASETSRILASIARSAIELLGGPDAARLRECSACGRFFLASRERQVWCSDACGNRSRVARHRSRRAAANLTR